MGEVMIHVYDVTNSLNGRANSAIVNLNKIMRDGIGLGGIFHGAVQIHNKEWSFGFCDFGTGVFSCPPKSNPMYSYRETVHLGRTTLPKVRIDKIIQELSNEWVGTSYDLLSRNCNHFCEELCSRLGVQKVPTWVNRFANAGDAAVEAAGNTMERLRQAKAEVVSATRVAFRFMFGGVTALTPGVAPVPGLQQSADISGSSSHRVALGRSSSRLLLARNQSLSTTDVSVDERPVKQNNHAAALSDASAPVAALEVLHLEGL